MYMKAGRCLVRDNGSLLKHKCIKLTSVSNSIGSEFCLIYSNDQGLFSFFWGQRLREADSFRTALSLGLDFANG